MLGMACAGASVPGTQLAWCVCTTVPFKALDIFGLACVAAGLASFFCLLALKLRAGDRVVDMATGTADVAIMISGELAKLESRGTAQGTVYPEVVGIDPSARMLEV